MDITKAVCVITGANRGLGFAMAKKISDMGATVVLACRDFKKAKSAAKEIGGKSFPMQVNVADTKSIEKFSLEIKKKFSSIDILINNAGVQKEKIGAGIEKLELKILQETLKINLIGTIWMCKTLLPLMKNSPDARIINFSSGLGQLSVPRMGHYPAYSISKTAVNQVTKYLAEEVKNTNIKVFSVDPGWIKTDMGGPEAPLSLEEGIDTPVWLATTNETLKSGEFYKERKILGW